ncbi:MAG: FecR domain-containing protein [Acidobacteriota bacterium]|nr:MAG: FecR domain-containing protein [Acidobacteriota bacterium]
MLKPSLPLFALFVGATLFATTVAGAPETTKPVTEHDDDGFVVVMTEEDSSTQALFDRYPEMSGSWEELAKFNLLRSGHLIEIPRHMLSSDGMLAKVASAYGDVEVKRVFDKRFIPVVKNLLLREGDEIRTWSGSGVRILFEDGNYVFVNSHTKVKVVSLGEMPAQASSRLQILLKEGSIWSQIKKQLKGRFEIRTSTANTIIRGTNFRVKVEPGDATRLEVLEGTVDFEVAGAPVSVGSQQGALTNGDGAPVSLVTLPPSPRTLDAPEPQEVIRGDEFNQLFRWNTVSGASAYHLVIAKDELFFDVVDQRQVGPEASVRIPSLEPGTYFWRVSTVTASGFEGSFSKSRYFVFVKSRP